MDILKFIHAHEHLLYQLSHSLTAAATASAAYLIISSSKYLVSKHAWVVPGQNLWTVFGSGLTEHTDIHLTQFDSLVGQLVKEYRMAKGN